ncbi:MAG: acyl-CoA thioesterase [Burkholderiaceae bacterium]|nr:acyl-CoA thioesterase [Burkholderiaceae bacterium]
MPAETRLTPHRRPSAAIEVCVPFHDVDLLRMVWHGRYPKYFELARIALLARLGFDEASLYDEGYAFPIVDLRVRYLQAIRLAQRIIVRATLITTDPMLRMSYEIVDADNGERLTRASSTQVATDATSGQRLPASDPLHARVAAAIAALAAGSAA